MRVSVETRDLEALSAGADWLVVPLVQQKPERWKLPARVTRIDRAAGGAIGAVLASGDFRGRAADRAVVHLPGGKRVPKRVLLLGMGEEAKLDADALRRVGGQAVAEAAGTGGGRVVVAAPAHRRLRPRDAAQALAEGAVLGSYRMDRYQAPKDDGPVDPSQVCLSFEKLTEARDTRAAAARGVVLAESQNYARGLSDEPPNELPPAALAREAQRLAKEVGLRCKVMDVPELRKRKMGALLAVGLGSAHPPRLIVLEHGAPARTRGKKPSRKSAPLCFVGKGITFDSGGVSIKPAANMHEMKHDMSGAAAVLGAMRAVALLGLRRHVVGVVAAAENLPSGTAYRPGDVVRSASGKTIEVLNTDAEGRVVLADALHYARSEYAPQAMVDLATLTGACMIALGSSASGLFGTDEALIERVRKAGEQVGEIAWPMPLFDEHREAMRGQVGDLKNAGGREAGASTAAAFLAAFAEDTPWVHLDIAGTGWTDRATPTQPRGATGVGVRLLAELAQSWR